MSEQVTSKDQSLAESLRAWADSNLRSAKYGPGLLRIAADEIERLQRELAESQYLLNAYRGEMSAEVTASEPCDNAALPSTHPCSPQAQEPGRLPAKGGSTPLADASAQPPGGGWRCECGEFMAPEHENCTECLKDRPAQPPLPLHADISQEEAWRRVRGASQPPCALRFPRQKSRAEFDWTISPAFLKQVKDAAHAIPEHYDIDMEQIEEVLIALETVYSSETKGSAT